jgi:hypothetical protein
MADDPKPLETVPATPASVLPSQDTAASGAAIPVAAPEPSIEVKPEVKQESTPTLLQEVVAEREAKVEPPVEAKPEVQAEPAKPEVKPVEAVVDPAPLAAVEYKYTAPEQIKMDDALKGEVHKAFDDFRANPSEGAQKLFDLAAQAMSNYATELDAKNRQAFADYRAEQRKAIMADPELGGSGHQTVKAAVARMRDLLFDPKDLQPRKNADGSPRLSAADEFLEYTGAGDHPVLWRALHRAASFFDEPQAGELPPNPRPPKDNGMRRPGRLRDTYDHPRSANGRA